jgi:hypothetical protein
MKMSGLVVISCVLFLSSCAPRLISYKLQDTNAPIDWQSVDITSAPQYFDKSNIIGEVWGWESDKERLVERAQRTVAHFGWTRVYVNVLEWRTTGTETVGQIMDDGTFHSREYNVERWYLHAFVLKAFLPSRDRNQDVDAMQDGGLLPGPLLSRGSSNRLWVSDFPELQGIEFETMQDAETAEAGVLRQREAAKRSSETAIGDLRETIRLQKLVDSLRVEVERRRQGDSLSTVPTGTPR